MCLHPRGMTTGAPPHNQQLPRHPGTTATTPSPTAAAKSSHGYTVVPSYLWALGIQSTTQTLSLVLPYLQLNSSRNRTVHIFDTYLTSVSLPSLARQAHEPSEALTDEQLHRRHPGIPCKHVILVLPWSIYKPSRWFDPTWTRQHCRSASPCAPREQPLWHASTLPVQSVLAERLWGTRKYAVWNYSCRYWRSVPQHRNS